MVKGLIYVCKNFCPVQSFKPQLWVYLIEFMKDIKIF